MIPNPIRRVLSSIREHRVRALLMGGQACVVYGAAEFSRGTDLVARGGGSRARSRPPLLAAATDRVGAASTTESPRRMKRCPTPALDGPPLR